MAGIRTIISGRLAQSRSKGAAFLKEMASSLSPEGISKEKGTGERKKK